MPPMTETMTDSKDTDSPADPPPRSRGGLGGLFRQVLRAFGEAPDLEIPDEPAGDLARHAHEFGRMDVGDVMTPRADISAIDINTPFDEVVARFIETEHSRLPLYRETLDDPVGVIHIKDIFKLLAQGGRRPKTAAVLKKLKREVLYVPESMRAADLLARMQASRLHMALVIDEYGGVNGLVSLEDLLEAVVGEIDDEHDVAQVSGVIVRPGEVFEADARAPLEDLEAAMEVTGLAPEDMDEEIDTVAGLVTTLAGRVPRKGDVIDHPDGWCFEVTDADPRRVKRVRVRRAHPRDHALDAALA
jgi:CBS domain containing-hemolysin-like protein